MRADIVVGQILGNGRRGARVQRQRKFPDPLTRLMSTAQEALERLREGNSRFVSGDRVISTTGLPARRQELIPGQEPMAVILGCADSRVPPELIFDVGLGDLFVVRVAGTVVAPVLLESIEYGVEALGARLVVVLGHSNCGAVKAAVSELKLVPEERSGQLPGLVEGIRPAVELVLDSSPDSTTEEVIARAIRANARNSASRLRHESGPIARAQDRDGLLVVSAEYSLETGVVDFFDGVPGERIQDAR